MYTRNLVVSETSDLPVFTSHSKCLFVNQQLPNDDCRFSFLTLIFDATFQILFPILFLSSALCS